MALKKLPGGVIVETDGGARLNEDAGVNLEAIHRQIVAGVDVQVGQATAGVIAEASAEATRAKAAADRAAAEAVKAAADKYAKAAVSSWDFTAPGVYPIWTDTANSPTPATAQTWTAWVGATPQPGNLTVFAVSWTNPAEVWQRRKDRTTWSPWRRLGADLAAAALADAKAYTDQKVAASTPTTPTPSGGLDYGIHQHEARLSDLRQRVGAPRVAGGAVTLICDHGTMNFRDKVLPLLRKHGIRCTLALNAGMYDTSYTHYAHESGTTWAEVKSWATSDGIEIANHGMTHKDTTGEAAIRQEIIGGREALEAALPGVKIDTWVQIGTTGTGTKWDGFNDGVSLDRYYTTAAGRFILDGHALVTGQVPHGGTPNRVYPLDGHPVIGASGYWLDGGQTGIDTATTKVTEAIQHKGGVILRLHPYLLDWNNQISTAQLDAFLGTLAARRDAGELAILPYREWALAVRA